jgi:hypothetical protein
MASDIQEIPTRTYNHSLSFPYQFYFFIRFHFLCNLEYLSFIPVPFLQIPLFRCSMNSLQQPYFWFPPFFTLSNRHLPNYLFCGLCAYSFCMCIPQQCFSLYLINSRPTFFRLPLPSYHEHHGLNSFPLTLTKINISLQSLYRTHLLYSAFQFTLTEQ